MNRHHHQPHCHKRPRHRRHHAMQMRLVLWFGATIFAAVATAGLTFKLLADPEPSWRRQADGAGVFLARQYARTWDDPSERDAITRSLSRDLGLEVQVRDARGVILSSSGPARCPHPMRRPIHRGPYHLGEVLVCGHPPHHGWQFGVALALALTVVWLLAGLVARRITKPVTALIQATRAMGEGDLESRKKLALGRRGEIGELTDSVYDMAERIETQMREQKELLAAVSHEIRTPLARIRVLADMAREGVARDKDPLAEIDAEVQEVDDLVGNLLAGARLDFQAVAPRSMEVRALLERAIERTGLKTVTVDAPRDLFVNADPTLLGRALICLLDNARKHGGPAITARARPTGSAVAITIEDDGPGFSDGDEERVFEVFARGKDSKERGGIGLGLALVRRIAEAHGGSVSIERRDQGAAVVLTLPEARA